MLIDPSTVAGQAVQAVGSDVAFGEVSFEWSDMLQQRVGRTQELRLPDADTSVGSQTRVDHMLLAYRALWDLCSILRRWRCRLNSRLSRELAELQSREDLFVIASPPGQGKQAELMTDY